MTELLNLVFGSLRSFLQRDTDLLSENLALRHQPRGERRLNMATNAPTDRSGQP